MSTHRRAAAFRILLFLFLHAWAATLCAAQPVQGPPAEPRRLVVKFRRPLAESLEGMVNAANKVDLAGIRPPAADEFVSRHSVRRLEPLFPSRVRSRRIRRSSEADHVQEIRARFGARAARNRGAPPSVELERTYVVETDGGDPAALQEALARLRADPAVEYAEEDKRISIDLVPNDPYFSSTGSWGQSYGDLYGLTQIGAAQAWDLGTGEGLVVAVVDTGIDHAHADLANNVWTNPGEIPGNGIDDDGNGYIDDNRGWDFIGASSANPTSDNNPMDDHGHGTHVAGTIAAEGNNGIGVIGVAWRSKVMAVKGLDRLGSGWESRLASAIVYAADSGADVINCSWGGKGEARAVADAIDYAYGLGAVLVVAAGNSNADASEYQPAMYPKVIAVAAANYAYGKANFSNWGSRVDVAAPGEEILSLRAAGTYLGSAVGDAYARASGTSMAAPHVAGLAALVLSHHPTFSVEEVRQVLRSSARDLGLSGYDLDFGAGLVSAVNALGVASALETKITSPRDMARVAAPTAISGSARGNGFAHYSLDYGVGATPTTWTALRTSTAGVAGGELGIFDPASLPDGVYTIRLTATDTAGRSFQDRMRLVVNYAEITSPVPPRVPCVATVFKPGTPLSIHGTATGPTFRGYRLEWARGDNPTGGWSSTGMSTTGGGTAPVSAGPLGSWGTAGISQADYYTIRLLVDNAGITSESRTTVYLEPDLLAGNWPRFLAVAPDTGAGCGIVPQTAGNGAPWLSFLTFRYMGSQIPATLHSYSPEGALTRSIPLSSSPYTQPAVGDLDPSPGEEIVVPDNFSLAIYRNDGTAYRVTIPPEIDATVQTRANFQNSLVVLEDLDGDGIREILSAATNFLSHKSFLFVWRQNGQLFNVGFPIIGNDHNSGLNFSGRPRVLVADFNRDGRKDILFLDGNSATSTTMHLYNADATPLTGWAGPEIAGTPQDMVVGDLDRDGFPEVVVAATASTGAVVHVLNSDGTVRAGWPRSFGAGSSVRSLALADMDRDGTDEIVFAMNTSLQVLRSDGTSLSAAWPVSPAQNMYFDRVAAIADVTGDGYPDILARQYEFRYANTPGPANAQPGSAPDGVGLAAEEKPVVTDGGLLLRGKAANHSEVASYPSILWTQQRLLVVDRNANTVRSWRIQGANGNQCTGFTAVVGDFDRRGLLQIAIAAQNVLGGEAGGVVGEGSMMVLNTVTPYVSANADWPLLHHDARNTSALFRRRPGNGIPIARIGGTTFSGFRNAPIAFDGTASSDPDGDPLSFRWNFGDGASGTGPTPSHAYANPGNFVVTLFVNDGFGDSAPVTAVAQVANRRPIANPGGPYNGLRNSIVAFDGAGSNDPDGDALEHQWDFGDGATGTGPAPTHTYAARGSYAVTLVVSDGVETSAPVTTTADVDNHVFVFDPISSPKVRGLPFEISVSARDPRGNVVSKFAGPATLEASGGAFGPVTLTDWVDGVWSGPVTVSAFGGVVAFTATDDSGHSGTSNTFEISTDSDGDGIPDDYEVANGLDPYLHADADRDLDGDGLCNRMEYVLDTPANSPENPGAPILGEGTGTDLGKLTLTFNRARAALTYTVQASDDQVTWVDIAVNPGVVGLVTVVDQNTTSPNRHLRLKVTVGQYVMLSEAFGRVSNGSGDDVPALPLWALVALALLLGGLAARQARRAAPAP